MDIDPVTAKWLLGSGGAVGFFVACAKYLPGLLSLFKVQRLDQKTLDAQAHAVDGLDTRIAKLTEQRDEKEALVNKLQIRNTRLGTMLIKLDAYIDRGKVPDALLEEFEALIKEL